MEKETIELLTKRYGYSYIMPAVCSFGILCNIINLSVLTNRRLKESPYTYLTALAIFDSLTLLSSLTTTFSRGGLWPSPDHDLVNYYWVKKLERRLFLPSANFFSAVSVSITVALTVERYIFIKFPMRASSYCSPKYARIIILIIALLVLLFRLPMYFFSDAVYVYNVPEQSRPLVDTVATAAFNETASNGTMSHHVASAAVVVVEQAASGNFTRAAAASVRIIKKHDGFQKYYFVASFVLFEILPFFTLAVLNLSLIVLVNRSISELQSLINEHGGSGGSAAGRRDSRRSLEARKSECQFEEVSLMSHSGKASLAGPVSGNHRTYFGNTSGGRRKAHRDNQELSVAKRRRDQLKLTRTLIAVVFITLLSEISSIITYDKVTEFLVRKFAAGIIDASAYMSTLYILQVFVSNLITLMLHSLNFFLYCAFNQRYRNTFRQTFRFFFRISGRSGK